MRRILCWSLNCCKDTLSCLPRYHRPGQIFSHDTLFYCKVLDDLLLSVRDSQIVAFNSYDRRKFTSGSRSRLHRRSVPLLPLSSVPGYLIIRIRQYIPANLNRIGLHCYAGILCTPGSRHAYLGDRVRRYRVLLGLADRSRIVAFSAYCDRVGTDRDCAAVFSFYITLFFIIIQNLIVPVCLKNFSFQLHHRRGRICSTIVCLTFQSL